MAEIGLAAVGWVVMTCEGFLQPIVGGRQLQFESLGLVAFDLPSEMAEAGWTRRCALMRFGTRWL